MRPAASGSGISVLLKKTYMGIIQRMVQYSSYYQIMSRVLFRVRFRIQCIIQKCPGYYSAYGSGFSGLFKNDPGIIQSLDQESAYY